MIENDRTESRLSEEELIKENRNLKRQLRNLESTFQRNKAMLSARTTINTMLESEQKKMERNMNLLLDNSADIILLFDKDGRFTYFTNTFLKATGIANSDLISGKHYSEIFKDLVSREWLVSVRQSIGHAMERRSTVFINSSVDFSGGDDLKDYDIQITPVMDQDGNLEAMMMLIHDMTEIIRAKRQAESASLAKSQFLATMSHEMRTPMNAVLGMTSIGKSATDKERMIYCFTKIEDASQHLLGVINDILDMSKIEANKFELSLADFSFEKMLQRVVNVVSFRVEEKKQIFMVHIDDRIPRFLFGDDQRLAQVIANLLGNAVKFTPEGGTIDLKARLMGEKSGICSMKIAVSDTGIGISAENQTRLFQSFQQAESDTTRKFGGTGLGLSISKNIVEMMGGKFNVKSEPGKGSVFAFTVQIKKSEKQTPFVPGANWGEMRVLAVDDDEDSLYIIKSAILGFGLSCDTALSGEEALNLVSEKGVYDFYFIDWKMPNIDGIELAYRLNSAAGASENSFIIMVSAAEWNTIETDARKAGFSQFISKPIFPSTLLDSINKCLGVRGEQQDSVPAASIPDFTGRRILLAEDVEINREIVLTLLEPTHLEIDCAENGAKAASMFSASPDKYEMIFMDVQMPEMDGYEATRMIRASGLPRAKTIPIVAMTANVFREDIEKCVEAGMNGHIGKPLDFADVISKLWTYL